jgi:predicted nucleic acid-binding Zn ribbon protein
VPEHREDSDSGSGQPAGSNDPVSRAREALSAARADARARGLRPVPPPRQPPPDDAGGAGTGPASAGGRGRAEHGGGPDPVPGLEGPLAGRPGTPAAPGGRPGRRAGARPGFAVQPQRDDPQPLAAAIGRMLDAEGWTLAAATGSVFGRWAQIVGADLAAHTTPETLTDGELTVAADSTAWATQVRLLAAQLVRRLNQELGDGTVRRVKVHGPASGTRKPGEWRVRGSRGPRDTYG